MRYVLTLIAGFAFGIYAVNVLSHTTYSKALLALGCRSEGRAGIWDWDITERYCADLSDMYPAQPAFDRMLPRIFAAHERPH